MEVPQATCGGVVVRLRDSSLLNLDEPDGLLELELALSAENHTPGLMFPEASNFSGFSYAPFLAAKRLIQSGQSIETKFVAGSKYSSATIGLWSAISIGLLSTISFRVIP
nr:hypothetical protein Iba_chr01bCG6640 [Ipomoea batatas]